MIKKARDVIDLYREKIARDKQSEADAVLIMQLLAGREVRAGKVNIRYLPRNGPEERRARSALAREVRRHMKGFSGELLALAIDPRTPTAIPGMRPTRKILFIGAAQGKESKWARDLRVVHFIRGELRKTTGKLEPALAAAEAEFGLKRSSVHSIYTSHQRLAEKDWQRLFPSKTK